MTPAPLKLCIMGNSHLAALRHAWTTHPNRWAGIDAHFVGAHKGLLLETQVNDGWLRPSSDASKAAFARLGGGRGIRLADYDGFVLAGCLVALSLSASVYRRLNWIGLPSVAEHENLAQDPKLLVSRGAAIATMQAKFAGRLGPKLIEHLRPHTPAPILLTSQPRASAAVLGSSDPKTRAHRVAHTLGDSRELERVSEQAANRAIVAAGGIYIGQPPPTITDHILTDPAFMLGAMRLTAKGDQQQPKDDVRHANAAYGALVLDQIASHFGVNPHETAY